MKIPHSHLGVLQRVVCAAALVSGVAASHATLQPRAVGYYDTVLNVTWASSANGLAGTPYDDGLSNSDGFATWTSANAWVSGLILGGTGGWRLPTIDINCLGFGCGAVTGELGYMFYVNLGGTGLGVSSSLFSSLVKGNYWSSTDHPVDTDQAGTFSFSDGFRAFELKAEPYGAAWAVHVGDVPEPDSAALIVVGLLALLGRLCRHS